VGFAAADPGGRPGIGKNRNAQKDRLGLGLALTARILLNANQKTFAEARPTRADCDRLSALTRRIGCTLTGDYRSGCRMAKNGACLLPSLEERRVW
jgi:hypothetical protein